MGLILGHDKKTEISTQQRKELLKKKEAVAIQLRKEFPKEKKISTPRKEGHYQHQPLQNPHWKIMRSSRMEMSNGKCEVCGKTAVVVHHLTYERQGEENLDDLISLCDGCHALIHVFISRRYIDEQGKVDKLRSDTINILLSQHDYIS